MKRTILTLFALVMATASLWSQEFKVDSIYYYIIDEENNTVEVTYRGSSYSSYSNEYTGSVTIPSSITYNGTTYSVTSIGEFAFYDCGSLTSVTIPESVIKIDKFAFSSCNGLPLITIPNSVISIGRFAFSNCTGLTSVTIPNSVTSIDSYAFYNCTGLTSVTIPNSVTSIDDEAFRGCTGLMSIYSQNPTPPTANKYTFDSKTFSDATLYVPVGSLSAYQEANVWKNFSNIVEIDFSGIEDVFAESTTVTVQGGAIVVNGVDNPVYIEVYNLQGQRVYSGYETTIPMNERGIYLVKIGNRVVKVML